MVFLCAESRSCLLVNVHQMLCVVSITCTSSWMKWCQEKEDPVHIYTVLSQMQTDFVVEVRAGWPRPALALAVGAVALAVWLPCIRGRLGGWPRPNPTPHQATLATAGKCSPSAARRSHRQLGPSLPAGRVLMQSGPRPSTPPAHQGSSQPPAGTQQRRRLEIEAIGPDHHRRRHQPNAISKADPKTWDRSFAMHSSTRPM